MSVTLAMKYQTLMLDYQFGQEMFHETFWTKIAFLEIDSMRFNWFQIILNNVQKQPPPPQQQQKQIK